ncbi:unnamed protein product [Prorocentrum cordatum]|uniref:EF-hand domain-containing protein n=1 Tax=Prorocentrum cordatum TaxID=2364126 RepID=A0ABN9RRS1_9DINO|nr:unnamed protein product [Polarella glacialis]
MRGRQRRWIACGITGLSSSGGGRACHSRRVELASRGSSGPCSKQRYLGGRKCEGLTSAWCWHLNQSESATGSSGPWETRSRQSRSSSTSSGASRGAFHIVTSDVPTVFGLRLASSRSSSSSTVADSLHNPAAARRPLPAERGARHPAGHGGPDQPQGAKRGRDGAFPGGSNRMDQLAARLLLTGSLMQLWLLHAVAAAFPLRSLHSPFRRDLGCLAAYSRTASVLFRYLGPLSALPLPVAMAIRWNRMGRWVGQIAVLLVPTAERQVGWHTLSFCWAASLPVLTTAAAWSVRSSLYSHHHLFITLTFLCHLTAALCFAVSLELVKWAVLGVGGIIAIGVLLFARYTAEFTSGSLLKAAQLQWACAHVVPILGVVLAAALEVEAGVAMALIEYICGSQDIVPVKMCIRSYFRRSRLAVMQEPSCYAATLAATGPSHDAAWVRLDGAPRPCDLRLVAFSWLPLRVSGGSRLQSRQQEEAGELGKETEDESEVLGMFDLGLTPRQLDRLTGQIFLGVAGNQDMASGGDSEPIKINVQSFLGRFCLVYKTAGAKLEKWMLDALDEVAKLIMRTPAQDLVSDRPGQGGDDDPEELPRLTSQEKEVKGLKGQDGTSSKDLMSAGTPAQPGRRRARRRRRRSRRPRPRPRKGLESRRRCPRRRDHRFAEDAVALQSPGDASGDGVLEIQEFVKGFAKVKGITDDLVVDGESLTSERILSIAKAIDYTGNGTINYMEFLQAFETSGEGQQDIGDTLAAGHHDAAVPPPPGHPHGLPVPRRGGVWQGQGVGFH